MLEKDWTDTHGKGKHQVYFTLKEKLPDKVSGDDMPDSSEGKIKTLLRVYYLDTQLQSTLQRKGPTSTASLKLLESVLHSCKICVKND